MYDVIMHIAVFSPEDDYTFVREETPEPTPEPPAPSPPKTPAKSPMKQEDVASQISETTAVNQYRYKPETGFDF